MILLLILAIAAAVRLPLVTMALPYYCSDTAVLDLMARHFLRGEFCLYYWGAHYYGVLDSILLMPLFRFFGATPQVSQVLPAVFSLVLLLCFHQFVKKTENPMTAHLATLVLAAASPALLHFTFTTYNYVFGPLFGFLFLLLAFAVRERPRDRRLCWLLGIVSGFGRYYFALILLFWATAGMVWWMERRSRGEFHSENSWTFSFLWRQFVLLRAYPLHPFIKRMLVFVNFVNLGNLVLAVGLWFHGDFIHRFGSQTVKIFFGPTFKFSVQAGFAVAAWVEWRRLWQAITTFWSHPSARSFVFGFIGGYLPALGGCLMGNFPHERGGFVSLPQIYKNAKMIFGGIIPDYASLSGYPALVVPTVLLLSGGVACLIYRFSRLVVDIKHRKPPPRWAPLAFLFAINLAVGLCYMEIGDVSTGRYFLPAYFSAAVGVACFIQIIQRYNRWAAYGLFALLLANNAVGSIAVFRNSLVPRPFSVLADVLLARGCRGGFADYWDGYLLTAAAGEKMIFAEPGDNNIYPPYLRYVQTLDDPVLIEKPGSPKIGALTIKGISYTVVRREKLLNTPVAWLKKSHI